MSTAAVSPTLIGPHSLGAPGAGAGDYGDAQTLSHAGCPRCGFEGAFRQLQERNIAQQRRIEELEAQARLLTEKAAVSAEKLADYQDGLQTGRRKSQTPSKPTSSLPAQNLDRQSLQQQSSSPPQQQTRLATLASYFPYGRRTSSNASAAQSRQSVSSNSVPQSSSSSSPPSSGKDAVHSNMNSFNNNPLPQPTSFLQGALDREQALRREAESRLTQANTELEELSAELFMRANEMVANERRERAKLEERVQVLEKRDKEKRARLERLEKAVERVERVKGLIGSP
ncbi:60S ribosomal protein L32 [Microsporum canis]